MLNADRVLSKAQILDHVWNYDFRGDDNIVESYISYLRRKVDNGRAAADPHPARRRIRAAQCPPDHHEVSASGAVDWRVLRCGVKLVAAVLALVLLSLLVIGVGSTVALQQLSGRPDRRRSCVAHRRSAST